MKKIALVLLFAVLAVLSAHGQAIAAYVSPSAGTWQPWNSAQAFGALGSTPPSVYLYCQATLGGPWTPCNPNGGSTTLNPLTGAASGGAAPGTTFNGSAAVTFDYHTLGAVPLAGGVSLGSATGSSAAGTLNFQSAPLVNGIAIGNGPFLPLAGGAMTGPITAANTLQLIQLGTITGDPGNISITKNATLDGISIYDGSGSTTSGHPMYEGEVDNVTGAVTNREIYHCQWGASNTTTSQNALICYAVGSHANYAVGIDSLADGLNSQAFVGQFNGAYGYNDTIGLAPYTITAVGSNGGNCQVTISGAIAFVVGASITTSSIGGATACNGTYTVLSIDNLPTNTQFTLNKAFSGTYTSGGTAQLNVSTVEQSRNNYSSGIGINETRWLAGNTNPWILYTTKNGGGGPMWQQYNGTTEVSYLDQFGNAALDALTLPDGDQFTHAPRFNFQMATGPLTAITTNEFFATQLTTVSGVLENYTASAATFTCSSNPQFVLADCGTVAGSCGSPSILATVTLTAAGTTTVGTLNATPIASGHWLAQGSASGACTVLNANATAVIREN